MTQPTPEPDRIVVMDEDEALRDAVRAIFEERGARVFGFGSAADAIAFVRQSSFDVALVDVRLPDASGVEVIPALKEVEPHCAVLLVTGNATLDTAIAAVGMGAFAYVEKPFSTPDLVTHVTQAVEQVRLLRERAALTRELARSEALYRGIFDTARALIVGLDAAGRVRVMNAEAERIAGASEGQARGGWFADLVGIEGGRAALESAIERARAGERVEIECSLAAPSGGKRRVQWSFAPLGALRGPEEIVLGVGIDITARREAERRAMQSEALAAMGALTTGLAHEIRNPLNAAVLQLELLGRAGARLEDAAMRDVVASRVRVVRGELARLERMLSEFLYLARPRGLEREAVPVGPLLREIAELEGPLAAEVGVRLQVAAAGDDLALRGDREKVKQLVINLVVNAIEALRGRAGGEIRLEAAAEPDGAVALVVRDNGPGIPTDLLDTIFEPFVTTKAAGTGLGLPIVKKIVEQHGGTIRLEADPGGGLAAVVILPRA